MELFGAQQASKDHIYISEADLGAMLKTLCFVPSQIVEPVFAIYRQTFFLRKKKKVCESYISKEIYLHVCDMVQFGQFEVTPLGCGKGQGMKALRRLRKL